MSEFQRYEFMTLDRPLTQEQLREVNRLSSHIDATSTRAEITYEWGDFKHDPIEVLHSYFDGFLYWANWGAPQLAFRFPHGVLPANLLENYDLDEFAQFTRYDDYDILDIHFSEMEGPDEWVEYELGPLMLLREELLRGDMRALYITWLAAQYWMGGNEEEEAYEVAAPPTPPGMRSLSSAQQALANLLRLPAEYLGAVAAHSGAARAAAPDDFAAWLGRMPAERQRDYLLRLANGEPGLNHLLARELRGLRPDATQPDAPEVERVTFATLSREARAVKERLKQGRVERERQAREHQLQRIHDQWDDYWKQATEATERGSGAGYDMATQTLLEMREVAAHFDEQEQFREQVLAWVQPHLKRHTLIKRLKEQGFQLPDA